jgi:hypothetical protein
MIVVNLLINVVSDVFGQYSISTGQDFIYATTLLILHQEPMLNNLLS